jgi:hypothetical protein
MVVGVGIGRGNINHPGGFGRIGHKMRPYNRNGLLCKIVNRSYIIIVPWAQQACSPQVMLAERFDHFTLLIIIRDRPQVICRGVAFLNENNGNACGPGYSLIQLQALSARPVFAAIPIASCH